MRARPLLFAFTALLFDCATLDKLPSGTCGNGVVDEATEDCDTFGVAGHDCGTSGVQACRLMCGRAASPPERPNADPACPPGWGCSVDHYCRQPTGQYESLTDPLSSDVVSMQVGDFDGDARKDILASGSRGGDNAARLKVHYFGLGGALEHVTPVNARISSPQVRDFDSDGKDDVVFGVVDVVSGIDVMRGQADRRLVPVTMPSQRYPATEGTAVFVYGQGGPTPDRAVTSNDPTTLLIAGTSQGQNFLASAPAADNSPALAVALPAPASKYVADPQWASLFASADPNAGTCGQVVIGMNVSAPGRDNGVIEIVSPCRGRRWATDSDPPPVKIELQEPLDKGLLVTDVDGDGSADIVFATSTRIFFLKGDGNSASFTLANAVSGARATAGGFPAVPLAVGDLNHDGVPDLVFPDGVFTSVVKGAPVGDAGADGGPTDSGAPDASGFGGQTVSLFGHTFSFAAPAPRIRWTTAVIADFNADGLADVAAGSSEAADIDFFQTTSAPPFVVFSTIPTTGPVLALRTGDHDGDGVFDLAIAEAQPPTGDRCTDNLSAPADIAYAYGKANGPPETPQVVARIDDFAAMPLILPTTVPQARALLGYERDDTASDPCTAPKTMTLGLLLGSGDRLPLAPLVFEIPNGLEATWRPLIVHSGPFVAKTPASTHPDIFAFAVKQDPSSTTPRVALWTAPSRGALRFDAPVEDPQSELFLKQTALIDPLTHAYRAATVAGDLDKDGFADIGIVLQLTNGGKSTVGVLYGGSGDPKSPPKAPPTFTDLDTRYVLGADSRASLVDVDGDGFQDMVLVLTDATARKQRRALVLRNLGGRIDPKAIELGVPSTADDTPVAMTPMTIVAASSPTGVATNGLAVVSDHHLYFATPRPDLSGFDVKNVTPASLVGVTDVAVADFDGDGVEDIAIADSGGIRLLRGKGRLP